MMVIVEDVNVVIHANMHQTENVMMVELVQTTTFVASAQTAKIATIRFHYRRTHEYFSKRNHCRFFENQPASNIDLPKNGLFDIHRHEPTGSMRMR